MLRSRGNHSFAYSRNPVSKFFIRSEEFPPDSRIKTEQQTATNLFVPLLINRSWLSYPPHLDQWRMERFTSRRGLEKDQCFLYFIWKHVSWRDRTRLLGINGNTGRLVVVVVVVVVGGGGGTPRPLWNRRRGRMSHTGATKRAFRSAISRNALLYGSLISVTHVALLIAGPFTLL